MDRNNSNTGVIFGQVIIDFQTEQNIYNNK